MPRTLVNVLAVIGGAWLALWALCHVGKAIGSAIAAAVPPGTTIIVGGGQPVPSQPPAPQPQYRTPAPPQPPATGFSPGEQAIMQGITTIGGNVRQLGDTVATIHDQVRKHDRAINDLGQRIDSLGPVRPPQQPCADCGGEWLPVPQ